tara:strand:- start:4557 stop:5522 length:966 start_codon:yes stop_codon:yes gene_type:complete
MNLQRPFRIEFEISSLCNALCSGCQRTMLDNRGKYYYKGNISISQMYDWFDGVNLKDARIKLCGVLGDPIINPDCIDICSYLLLEKNVKNIEISTNGGARTKKFWTELAELSKYTNKRLYVHWSIDGVTKNDYRENVNIDKVWNNFHTYYNAGGKCIWQYIHFDYNADEIELAKEKAKKLDIELKIRVSWRNTSEAAKFKSSEALKIDSNVYEKVEQKARSGNYEESNIVCRHKIENELFVTSEGKVWPCCHLQDEQVSGKTDIIKKIGLNNDLKKTNFYDIISSEWYSELLENSWNKNHPLHLSRCYLSCGDFAKRKVIK